MQKLKRTIKVDEDLYYLMGEIYFRLEELKKSKTSYEKFVLK